MTNRPRSGPIARRGRVAVALVLVQTPPKRIGVRLPKPPVNLYGRLVSATFFLLLSLVIGAAGYYYVGEGRWNWFECFYMTVITLSTVGFGETLDGMHQVQGARVVTIVLIVLGSGTLLYFISNFTALIVEGDLQGIIRSRGMRRAIEKLENHIIVCGVGSTGVHIVEELLAVNQPFVVIDQDEERIRALEADLRIELLHVVGDATDDHTLEAAGIDTARGVIAALHDDKDNLFVTISAKALNRSLRIVAKAVEAQTEKKLVRAGADSVVSPTSIGGMRLVSEMIRPRTVEFLDRMLRDKAQNLRVDEAEITEESPLVDKTLAQTSIRNTGALVIAVRLPHGEYIYNPPSDLRLQAGAHLIVIAPAGSIQSLRDGISKGRLGPL